MIRLQISLLVLFVLFLFSAPMSSAATQIKNTVRTHTESVHGHSLHNGKRLFLVPPPPPYVPSLLPELTYSRYYGHSPYSYSHSSNSPRLFKPNKYLTYCL